MMRPHLRAFMPGQTSLEKRIAANSLRSRSSCQASSEMFSNAIVRARAGIVDEDVDRAEIGDDLLMRLGNVGSLGDVADIVADLEAVLREQFPRGLQVGRAAREDRDLGARGGELPCNRKPNALAAAGDDGDAIFHRDLHVVLPIAVFRAAGQADANDRPAGFIMVPLPGMIKQPAARADLRFTHIDDTPPRIAWDEMNMDGKADEAEVNIR